MHTMRPLFLMAFLLWVTAFPTVNARDLRADPATGRIRVIYMGDAIGVSNPFPIINLDPTLYCTAVYACTIHQQIQTIRRSVRAYIPRTYSKFLNHDVVVLSDANRDAFRTEHFEWMKKGVLDGGQGLIMVGGAESFTGKGGTYPTWEPTAVADILPCDMISSPATLPSGRIKIVDYDDEFIKSLPFETLGSYGVFSSSTNIQPRTTAALVAVLRRGLAEESPFLMWWDIGKGRTVAQSADWTPAAGVVFMRWKYYGDYVTNMILFLAGQKLPDDIEMVYLVRRRMREANEAIGTLYSMVDMVEKFGGTTYSLSKMIGEVQEAKEEASHLYVQGMIDESLEAFSTTLLMSEETMGEALKARDDAAYWIFFTEWCVVTGALLASGSILWLIMVRRRLYREVKVTRYMEGQ